MKLCPGISDIKGQGKVRNMKLKPTRPKEVMSPAEAFELYLEGKSLNTVRKYRQVYGELLEYLNKRKIALTETSAGDILKFLHGVRLKPGQACRGREYLAVSEATVCHKIVILRALFEFFLSVGVLEHNPLRLVARTIRTVEQSERRPTELTPFEKVPEILKAPCGEERIRVRDRAFLGLLYGLALRLSEALSLTMDSFHEAPESVLYVAVRGKGGKCRNLPLPSWLIPLVTSLIKFRELEGASENDKLFIGYYKDGRQKGPWPIKSAEKAFKKWVGVCGLKNISPHSARATAITRLLSMGEDWRAVQEFSRHSSVQMVERYDKRRFEIKNSPGRKIIY